MSRKAHKGKILVVDDETNARTALAELLRDEGYTVETAADGFKALPKVESFAPEILITDLKMPGMDGLELMKKGRAKDSALDVVMMTAFGAVDSAVSALQQGALHYLTKPINMEELLVVVDRAMQQRQLRRETARLRSEAVWTHKLSNMVGTSAAMQHVAETIAQIAQSRASVLITGESGTGKELVAHAIHQQSSRAEGPFVRLHCAALADTLLESELFGHEKGAFTGAVQRRAGRFEQADGGTLFLDEIGEVSESVQVKLLRFLQEREFERVGSNQTLKVDVRIVAATHRDLMQRTRDGYFREDLYYRLNVVSIHMPPLRERREDVLALAMHFLKRSNADNNKQIEGFGSEALAALEAYHWPGNIRELENAIERAVVICRSDEIQTTDLGLVSNEQVAAKSDNGTPSLPVPGSTLEAIERHAILTTLEACGGSTSKAADLLGISARKIQYKLQQYSGLEKGGASGNTLVDEEGLEPPTNGV